MMMTISASKFVAVVASFLFVVGIFVGRTSHPISLGSNVQAFSLPIFDTRRRQPQQQLQHQQGMKRPIRRRRQQEHFCHGGSLTRLDLSTSNDDDDSNHEYEDLCAAIIVPGFLTGASEFQPLANELTKLGIPTIPLPMPNWHWLPCLGGRSARPILERIDYTVRWLIANDGNITKSIPPYQYSLKDAWIDFRTNPGGIAQVGGSSKVEEYPDDVTPQGSFPLPPPPLSPELEQVDKTGNRSRKSKRVAVSKNLIIVLFCVFGSVCRIDVLICRMLFLVVRTCVVF
jgi:hypothetical protein